MSLDAGRVGVRADQVDIHGRVTSPSFLNELLESLPEWTDMPVWVNGTEELLPSNTSAPVTSPILADIAYPDIRRDNQYFTYRESPTPVDGLAKIKSIKGNTLVWNQNCYSFSALRSTLSSTVNSQTDITCTALSDQTSFGIIIRDNEGYFNFISGHTYLLSMNISEITVNNFSRISPESTMNPQNLARETGRYTTICTPTASGPKSILCYLSGTTTTSDKFKFNSVQIVDLTILNDSRITDYDSFRTYYPLSFYPYNSGSLLSFNGNGIKTVSKNQFDTQVVTTSYQGLTLTKTQGTIRAVYSGGSQYAGFNFYGSPVFTDMFLKSRYRLSFDVKGLDTQWTVGLRRGASFLGGGQAIAIYNDGHYSFTIDTEANPNCYLSFARTGNKTTAYDVTFSNIQLELGTTETSYVPYTSSTLSLPISTYFPNGMKSALTVYDELTPTKAITRIGSVDLGSLNWEYNESYTLFIARISDMKETNEKNIICSIYQTVDYWINTEQWANNNMIVARGGNDNLLRIKNTSYNSAYAFKTAMSGVYLFYELATPVELPTLSLGE